MHRAQPAGRSFGRNLLLAAPGDVEWAGQQAGARGGCRSVDGVREEAYIPGMLAMTQYPDGSYRAATAVVVGDVRIGRDSSLWFNVVLRGDVAPIEIGRKVNVQDQAVIHCDRDVPNVIEDEVSIGHGAVVHGSFVGRGTLIGMGAVVLGGSRIGAECLVAAGAVVPPNLQVPDRMVVMGVPGRITRPVTEEELGYFRRVAGTYLELARRYAEGRW